MDFQKRREGSKEHIEVSKGRGNFEVFGKLRNCIQEGSEIEFQKKRKGNKKNTLKLVKDVAILKFSESCETGIVTTSLFLSCENEYVAKSTVTVILWEWLHTDIQYVGFKKDPKWTSK